MIQKRVIVFLVLCFSAAGLDAQNRSVPGPHVHITGYDFTSPSSQVKLPRKLREISGLTFSGSGKLYAVQDENGIIYGIDIDSGKVLTQSRFHSGGDYEGIEIVGDSIYVLRSSGHLYALPLAAVSPRNTVRTKLGLPADCNAEALGSSKDSKLLLVGCKSGDGRKGVKSRSIYALEIATGRIEKNLILSITQELLSSASPSQNWSVSDFQPSALAIHPETGMLYVLSAVNELLLIVSENKTWLVHFELPYMPQPEGMAFGPDATLYIASEGTSGKAVLFSFRYAKKHGTGRE